MATFGSRFGKTVGNLLLAFLNATLILVAVCLYLEWRVVRSVDGLVETFSQNLIQLSPLRDSVDALTLEAAELRSELAVFADTQQGLAAERAIQMSAKIENLNENLASIQASVGSVIQNPKVLVDSVIEKSAQELIDGLADLRGCEMPANT